MLPSHALLASEIGTLADSTNGMSTYKEAGQAFQQDALQVLLLIDHSIALRAQLPGFIQESNAAISKHHGALPSAYALRLAKALSTAHQMRNDLFKQALTHRAALYRVDDGLNDHARVTEIIIAMAAAVTLFENNNEMHLAFVNSPLLRKKLNEGYPEFDVPEGYYDAATMRSNNREYRKAFADAVQYFADNRVAIEAEINQSSDAVRALYQHIAISPLLKNFKGANVFKEIVTLPVKTVGGAVNLTGSGLNKIKFTSSKVVGNTIGAVRWRDGKLKGDTNFIQTMLAHLQPGDILLEKTPFTLTDKSIPGHFGHAAIYIGTAEQLKEINALTLPVVQKHYTQILDGHGVVEALRNGVQLNKLGDFMNVDDIAILRPKNLTPKDQLEAISLALGNLGKKYDFNFDVNTTETIVCSELVYIAYPQVDFVTKNVLGSFAITPDDIAVRAGPEEDEPLQIVLFGHDGKLVLGPTVNDNGLALYDKFVKGIPLPEEALQNKQREAIQRAAFSGFL